MISTMIFSNLDPYCGFKIDFSHTFVNFCHFVNFRQRFRPFLDRLRICGSKNETISIKSILAQTVFLPLLPCQQSEKI